MLQNKDYLNKLYQQKEYEKVIEKAKELLKEFPSDIFLYNIMGISYNELGKYEDAIDTFKGLIQIDPNAPQAYYNMARNLSEVGEIKAAITAYKKAIALKEDYIKAYYNLAIIFMDLARYDEAQECYEKALFYKPDYIEAYENYAVMLVTMGEIKRLEELAEKVLALDPKNAQIHYTLSRITRYYKGHKHIQEMETFLAETEDTEGRVAFCFALAKAYEDIKEYERSFRYLKEGNDLNKSRVKYDIENTKKIFKLIKEIFTKTNEDLHLQANDTKQPIFILGMPRSGTTLVEQIIASHSSVYGAGELEFISSAAKEVLKKQAECKNNGGLTKEDIENLHKKYLRDLERFDFEEKIFTDKMPHNFIYIGFILEAFPNAKIVHLNRDPMAVCWSMYKLLFPAEDLGYSFDMQTLVIFYKLYEDMMQFWKQKYPGRIYDISYEKLTQDQEEETRKLLAYCDLEWEDACLEFHKNKRAVKTASTTQVKKKMYQGSSQAWKKYENYLKPLLLGLESISIKEKEHLIMLYEKQAFSKLIEEASVLLAKYPKDTFLYEILGNVYNLFNQYEKAIKCFIKLIEIDENNADAYYNLAIVLSKKGDYKASVENYKKAIQLNPNYFTAYNNLGLLFQELKQYENALYCFNEAIKIKPDFVEAYMNFGNTLVSMERAREAVAYFEKGISINPNFANLYYNLAICYRSMERVDETVQNYKKAISVNPNYINAYINLSILYKDIGERDNALVYIRKVLDLDPNSARGYFHLSSLIDFSKENQYISKMEDSLQRVTNIKERGFLSFALAKAYEDCKEYERSFSYFKKANEYNKHLVQYNIEGTQRVFAYIKQLFSKKQNLTLDRDVNAKKPIFIVGMPRSGTTLVEQIISSHSKVHGCGELEALPKAVRSLLSHKVAMKSTLLNRDEIVTIRESYLKKITQLDFDEEYFTDKLPHNFIYIGFILEAFPDAKIIHLKREPMAVCWSLYKNHFPASELGYSFDMKDLAHFYKLYEDMMQFWKVKYPDRIYDLSYEKLTEDQESQTKELLEYCGLEWEKRCLDFHTQKRLIKTASNVQIRSGMYQGSSQAWKKYEKYLQELKDRLYN